MPAGAEPPENEGVLFPIVQDDFYGFIDRNGVVRIKPQFSLAWGFRDGLAPVERASDHLWGYINTKGEFVIQPRFSYAAEFSEGLAYVREGSEAETPASSIIDLSGHVVFRQSELDNAAESFSEGLKGTIGENNKWGYVDRTGAVVIPAQFDESSPFSDGVAHVVTGGRSHYIDKTGAAVITLPYKYCGEFRGGLAPVSDGKKWGYADKSGKIIVPIRFDAAENFSEGLAAVSSNGKWGVIDTRGKWVVKPRFEGLHREETPIGEFSNGLARVSVQDVPRPDKHGYIDRTGKFVWKPTN